LGVLAVAISAFASLAVIIGPFFIRGLSAAHDGSGAATNNASTPDNTAILIDLNFISSRLGELEKRRWVSLWRRTSPPMRVAQTVNPGVRVFIKWFNIVLTFLFRFAFVGPPVTTWFPAIRSKMGHFLFVSFRST
jgi:hypothetical protein